LLIGDFPLTIDPIADFRLPIADEGQDGSLAMGNRRPANGV
jgi:hypothetical protein